MNVRSRASKSMKTIIMKKRVKSIRSYPVCVFSRCKAGVGHGTVLSPWGPDAVVCLGRLHARMNVWELGGFVRVKPCDCGHVSRLQTDSTQSHEPHVLDGAFNSSPSPRAHSHTHTHRHRRTRAHTHTHRHAHTNTHTRAPPPLALSRSTTHFCSSPPLGLSLVYHHAPAHQAHRVCRADCVYMLEVEVEQQFFPQNGGTQFCGKIYSIFN